MNEILVPFSGFYNSWHSQESDNALDSLLFENARLIDRAIAKYNWSAICECYAESYTDALSSHIELPLAFKSLHSPKYYNFETDRIIATISDATVEKLTAKTPTNYLRDVCEEWFTSRDGFISHYRNDYTLWSPDRAEWDHNQLGALLVAWMRSRGISEEDVDIVAMELMIEQGQVEGALFQDPNIARLADVAYRLQQRHDRAL